MSNVVTFAKAAGVPRMPLNMGKGFALGSIVTLKSGGPACLMGVIRDGKAMVHWYDNDGQLHSQPEPVEALQLLMDAPVCDDSGRWANCTGNK